MKDFLPISHKIFVVLGLGRSGLAAAKWLMDHGGTVYAADDRPEICQRAHAWGAQTGSIPWDKVKAVIQSPGVPLTFPKEHPLTQMARSRNIPIMGDCDLFRLLNPAHPSIGITGTNGKSTTTVLIGHILRFCGIPTHVGGNIGVPVFDLPTLPETGIYVLELSSFQLDLSHSLNLSCVVWTNITEDHMDRHDTMAAYLAAKKRIFRRNTPSQIRIIGIDDPLSFGVWEEMIAHDPEGLIAVSVRNPATQGFYIQDDWLVDNRSNRHTPVFDCTQAHTLQGTHNKQNLALAYAACVAMGCEPSRIAQSLTCFPGLAHRQEYVRTVNGIRFINDSKATNADAAARALDTFSTVYWIAGGQPKTGGIERLSPYFPKIVKAFLIGEAQKAFQQTLRHHHVACICSDKLEQAINQAYAEAQVDGKVDPVVLLAPACASYDQFRDFEDRGDQFRDIVRHL